MTALDWIILAVILTFGALGVALMASGQVAWSW